ncbi:MAG: hypothetical protein ACFFG0_06440 [Candidatus Thorarchaeota archaeon]
MRFGKPIMVLQYFRSTRQFKLKTKRLNVTYDEISKDHSKKAGCYLYHENELRKKQSS